MSISVVIPALNEERALPANIAKLLTYPGVHECIVVDGGSVDATCECVEKFSDSRVRLLHSAPGRGRQMNIGAASASGDMLLFHHADTHLPPEGFSQLVAACTDTKVHWGGFRHQFSQPNWKLGLVSWLHNFRFRHTGVVYGDQSMFVRKAFFERVGGFKETGLEDLDFSDRALEHEPSTSLPGNVVTDSRKFRQMGELKALGHVIAIILRYQWNTRIANERFFEPYR